MVGRLGVDEVHEARDGIPIGGEQAVLLAALRDAECVRQPGDLGLGALQPPLLLANDVVDGGRFVVCQPLFKVADNEVRRVHCHGAGVGRFVAGQNAHQRGLAAAVWPDEANPVAGIHGEGNALQDVRIPVMLAQIRYL